MIARFQPYLVGLGLGYILYKMKEQPKLPFNPMALSWIWAIAFLVGCLVIYGLVPYQKDPTLAASLGCSMAASTGWPGPSPSPG